MAEQAHRVPTVEEQADALARQVVVWQDGDNAIPPFLQCDPTLHVNGTQKRLYSLAAEKLGSLTKEQIIDILGETPEVTTEGSAA